MKPIDGMAVLRAAEARVVAQTKTSAAVFERSCQLLPGGLSSNIRYQTHAALGRLYTEARRPDRALVAYRAACEVVERVKVRLLHPPLHSSLDRAPLIRQIYEQSAPR